MSEIEPLCIVKRGVRYGVHANGKTAWLPPSMWTAAAALVARMDAMNATAERMQMLIDAAQAEADAFGGVQTAYHA